MGRSNLFGKLALALFLALSMAACSSTGGGKVDSETGEGAETSAFSKYKENRPDREAKSIGVGSADKLFSSIAGIYGRTIDLSDQYIARVENSKVILVLEELRQTAGEDAYKKEVAALDGEDRKQYDEFIKNETNELEVVVGYLTDALKLQQSIAGLDVKGMISNPFELPSALKATSHAKEQMTYTIDSLKWLKATREIYQAMQEHSGR